MRVKRILIQNFLTRNHTRNEIPTVILSEKHQNNKTRAFKILVVSIHMVLNADPGFDITLDLTTATKEEGEKSLLPYLLL
jgi:hypothetical protein